jgi:DnaJ family protein C protein 28
MSQEKKPSRLVFRMDNKLHIEPTISEEERLRLAREKSEQYRNPNEVLDQNGDVVKELDEWANLVTKRIEEAMRRGEFDNLAGRGKPIHLEKNPYVPEGQEMANAILKNNDVTPTWIADRKEMLRAIEAWRDEFQRVVSQASSAWVAAGTDKRRQQIRDRWASWLLRWEDELTELNRRIGTFNLVQPINHLEIFKLRLDDELKRVGMARTLER